MKLTAAALCEESCRFSHIDKFIFKSIETNILTARNIILDPALI